MLFGAQALAGGESGRIRPWPKNPRYWEYRGKPVLLLGGSRTDHIFLLDDLEAHLDEIRAAGGNYVRSTMSQREGADLKPHLRLPDGRFDLERWNPEYWKRFADCLRWTHERDIIMQIEVWDRFDYSQEHWLESAWNPKNNVNYTSKESGLAERYPQPAWRDRQPFFHTLPGMPLYKPELERVRAFQERFVERMLSFSLEYPHVLYCMNNETSTDPRWGRYWMRVILDRARAKGVEVHVTDMFDDAWKPERSAKLAQAIQAPELYTYLDVSQVNSRNFNEDHWRRFLWIVRATANPPRPLNHTKIYSDGNTSWGSGTPKDGVERFFRNLIGGAASCRFHRPGAGIGLNAVAKAAIRAARKAESAVPFWDLKPRLDLLRDREEDEAYLATARDGRAVLYFTDGGSVGLDLGGVEGKMRLRWIDIARGEWAGGRTLEGGAVRRIDAPRKGGWIAVIVPAGGS